MADSDAEDEQDQAGPGGPPSSVLGPRLARNIDTESLPSWDDLGLGGAKAAAFQWQQQRAAGRWNETSWAGPGDGWVREIHGLFGIAAELLLVTLEAEVEKQLHLDLDLESETATVWSRRALRFFAEGQSNYLVVFGHTVSNIVIRTQALHRTWSDTMLDGLALEPAAFQPRSDEREAWLSLNRSTARRMVRNARSLGPGAEAMSSCARELPQSGAWAKLNDLRGSQYHRWRSESPGIAASDRAAPTAWERLTAGEVVSFPGTQAPFTDGDEVVTELVAASREALDQVAAWMPRFHEAWTEAYHEAADSHHPKAPRRAD